MKKHIFAFVAMSLVAILVLGACAPVAEMTVVPEPTVAEEMAVVQEEPVVEATAVVEEAPATELTDAEMEALISEKIKDKHTLEFILSQEKTAEEWSETLDRMIGYGAEISPEEKALIIDWLVNRNK
jgi:uncharacterized protein YgbK (DUF1537 family)